MKLEAYLLENTIFVVSRGGAFASYFEAPTWVFRMNARPNRGAFAAFPNKRTNAPQMPGGGEMGTLAIDCATK